MEKSLHNVDHCAELVDARSPASVSGGATGVYEDLKNLLFVETYSAVGTESIQLFLESKRRMDFKQL